jgi:hypothetical protein
MYRWGEVVSTIFKEEALLKNVPRVGRLKKDLKITDWDAIVNFGEHTYPILDKKFPNSNQINWALSVDHETTKDYVKTFTENIINFGGGQVDITNGKFVFSCTEAYRVKNGKIGLPIGYIFLYYIYIFFLYT